MTNQEKIKTLFKYNSFSILQKCFSKKEKKQISNNHLESCGVIRIRTQKIDFVFIRSHLLYIIDM